MAIVFNQKMKDDYDLRINAEWRDNEKLRKDNIELAVKLAKAEAKIKDMSGVLLRISNMPWPNSEAPYARLARKVLNL